MKISYSNYPILKKLTENNLGVIPFYKDDGLFIQKHLYDFKETWKKNKHHFSKEINYVSTSFSESVVKSYLKLAELYQDIVHNDLDDFIVSGTYILNNNVYMIYHDMKKGSQDYTIVFYLFSKMGMPLIYYRNSNLEDNYFAWVSNAFGLKEENEIKYHINKPILDLCLVNMFKKFSQVEIKELAPNSKTNDIKCKYVNDTKSIIKHLDCTWYTTLVKSDCFNVSGHLRWQPKKVNGEWKKELIWIEDFKKNGYTRKASKLLSE